MEHLRESNFGSSGVLDGIGDIKKEVKIDALIRAYASVITREEGYNKSANELGLETYPSFELNGSTADVWKRDIKLRIDIINQATSVPKQIITLSITHGVAKIPKVHGV